ncbi:TERB2 protein, partial [Hemiprocne comata]|nr:TERB2 protein [Hemiprocne comata]
IHQSLDYLEGRATVFHSCYVSAWASSGARAKPSVVLGHFVLPPACLQEGVWGENIRTRLTGIFLPLAAGFGHTPRISRDPQCIGNNSDFFPPPQCSSEEETVSRAPSQGEFLYRALQEYPVNNMVTAGYASARHMKKYTGELRDFTPGTSGYAAYWVRAGIGIYSDTKTKMKRKL